MTGAERGPCLPAATAAGAEPRNATVVRMSEVGDPMTATSTTSTSTSRSAGWCAPTATSSPSPDGRRRSPATWPRSRGARPPSRARRPADRLLSVVERRPFCSPSRGGPPGRRGGALARDPLGGDAGGESERARSARLGGPACRGVNRISMGVQSLHDADLRTLARGHTAAEARGAYSAARAAGFRSVSIDLIYGLPGQSSGRLG